MSREADLIHKFHCHQVAVAVYIRAQKVRRSFVVASEAFMPNAVMLDARHAVRNVAFGVDGQLENVVVIARRRIVFIIPNVCAGGFAVMTVVFFFDS